MMPRLQAEHTQRLIEALMATNARQFTDAARNAYMDELGDLIADDRPQRPRAPKVTRGFLERIVSDGVQVTLSDGKGGEST